VPGLLATDHFITVPLDHSGQVAGQLTVFCRQLVAPGHERSAQPYLLYLQGASVWGVWVCTCVWVGMQATSHCSAPPHHHHHTLLHPPPPPNLQGGPGFEAPRPSEASGWIKAAAASFRIILMDQRGTGRSSPVTTNSLARLGSPQAQAEHLAFFR
jgi:hypothetical protein